MISRLRHDSTGTPGFTLLETIISLTIFLSVAVPLMSRLWMVANRSRDIDRINGHCLIEREACRIRLNSGAYSPEAVKTVLGRKYRIETRVGGMELKKFTILALRDSIAYSKLVFYVYDSAP